MIRWLTKVIIGVFLLVSSSFTQEIHEIAVVDLGEAFEVVIHDTLAYVADGFSGLRIFDVSDPANPNQIGNWDTPDNNLGLTFDDDQVLLADGSRGFQIVDVSDPENVALLGSADTEGFARRVRVRGDLAFIVDYRPGLLIYDVSQPDNPQLIGQSQTNGDARGVHLGSTEAYIAASTGGLRIVNISNPTNPFEISFCDTPGNAIGVARAGHYIYIADWDAGIRIIDISNLMNPVEVGMIETPDYTYDVAVQNNRLFTAEWERGFRIFDLLDPETPQLIGEVNTPGFTASVTPDQILLYACDYEGGLRIYDTSELFDPPEISMLQEELDFGVINIGTGRTSGMQITNIGDLPLVINNILSDNEVFEVEFEEGHTILPQCSESFLLTFEPPDTILYEGTITITSNDPDNPEVHTSLSGSGRIQRIGEVTYLPIGLQGTIALLDEHVFLGKNNGFSVVDISNPANPVEVDSFETEEYGYGLAVSGNLAITVGGDDIYIIDVSNPEQIVEIGTYSPDRVIFASDFRNDFAYLSLGDGSSTFQIVNLTNPQDPTLDSEIDFDGGIYNIFLTDNFAWCSHHPNGLVKIDISNPEAPEVVGEFQLDIPVHSIFAVNNVVYFTSGHTGVHALIINDQNDWQVVNTPTPEWAWEINVQDDLMFVASIEGLHILDVADHDHNRHRFLSSIAYIERGTLRDVVARNGFAFASGESGLYVFDVSYFTGVSESPPRTTPIDIPILATLEPAFPNPFNSSTNLSFTLSKPSRISLHIFDITGKFITSATEGVFNTGVHQVEWESPNLAGGVYLLNLSTDGFSTTQKIVNLR